MINSSLHTRISGAHASPWLVMTITSLGVFLVNINLGALNVALPAIARYFDASAAMANWILLSYMLVNTILILVFGQLADTFGRHKLYLLGMIIFTCMSLALGFAPNGWTFIILRVLQAAGGALIITNNIALITDALPESLLGKAFGINALVGSGAQLIGPVIGGVIASKMGWQWVFWACVPFGILGVLWGKNVFQHMPMGDSTKGFDWAGGLISIIALSGLIVVLSEGSTLGWGNFLVIGGFMLFILLIPVLIWVEKRVDKPMFDFTLFRDRSYTLANVSTFLNSFVRVTVVLLVSLYLQSVMHLDAFWAGFGVLPVTVGMLVASPIAGYLSDSISTRVLCTLGLAISAVGLLILLFALQPDMLYLGSGIGMGMVGFGSGLFLTPNTKSIMMSVPYSRRGFANGLRSMLQNMGQLLSTAISLTIVTSVLPHYLQDVVFRGATNNLPRADLDLMTSGYHFALLALLLATLLGIVTSSLRGTKDSNKVVQKGP